MEISGPAPEAVLLFPWTQAKAEKLPGHFPPCLVHSSHIDFMVVVDSCHVFVCSQDGAFIEYRCGLHMIQFKAKHTYHLYPIFLFSFLLR